MDEDEEEEEDACIRSGEMDEEKEEEEEEKEMNEDKEEYLKKLNDIILHGRGHILSVDSKNLISWSDPATPVGNLFWYLKGHLKFFIHVEQLCLSYYP